MRPGDRLGVYEIEALLGAGGMGEVYQARDTRLDRTVAIKVLPASVAADKDRYQRFDREARAIASLDHPHIRTLYDIGQQDGVHFLVMQYLDGETLAARLARGPMPLEQVLHCAIEIAEALDHAHRHDIVHRDVKPGNIFLARGGGGSLPGEVKLLDFGLARLQPAYLGGALGSFSEPTRPQPLTESRTILGTWPYMAPEQLEGRAVDARSDIFAFGAVVYEMATGTRAFAGDSPASLIAAILGEEPPPISARQPLAPPALDHVIRKCLAKDPESRWQTVRDLADELKWIAQERRHPSQATDHAPTRSDATLSRRRVIPLRHVAALVVVSVAIAALAALKLATWVGPTTSQTTAPASPPTIRFVVDTPPVTTNIFGGLPSAAVARDGSVLVYVATENGVRSLYQRRMGETRTSVIPGTEGAYVPFLSPDGTSVGFTVASGTGLRRLRRVSLAGGAPVTICELGAGRGASWGPDHTIVFSPNPDEGLWQVPAAGGVPQRLTSPDAARGERSHRWPYLVPERRIVLYTIARSDITSFDDAVIASRDLETGQVTELVRGGSYPIYAPATGHLLYSRAGALLAAAFNPDTGVVGGPSVTVRHDVVTYPFTGAAEVSTSDAGVLISVSGGPSVPSTSVVIVDRQGKSTPIPFPLDAVGTIRLSPDGRTVALEADGANSSIWVGDLTRATAARLTPTWTNTYPVWSPDGSRIAFSSSRGGSLNVFWQPIDGSGEAEQLTRSDYRNAPTSWSSDGYYVAYDAQAPSGARDVMALELREPRNSFAIAKTPFDEQSATFSPDGKLVAYVSDESGRFEVYLQTFPVSGRRVPVTREGGVAPVWARDGRELYYRNGNAVMVVEVRTAPTLSAGSPRRLFRIATNNPRFDVTHDGRFLMIEDRESPLKRAPLSVTVNWLDVLRNTK